MSGCIREEDNNGAITAIVSVIIGFLLGSMVALFAINTYSYNSFFTILSLLFKFRLVISGRSAASFANIM